MCLQEGNSLAIVSLQRHAVACVMESVMHMFDKGATRQRCNYQLPDDRLQRLSSEDVLHAAIQTFHHGASELACIDVH